MDIYGTVCFIAYVYAWIIECMHLWISEQAKVSALCTEWCPQLAEQISVLSFITQEAFVRRLCGVADVMHSDGCVDVLTRLLGRCWVGLMLG